jgi:hypothetical protein
VQENLGGVLVVLGGDEVVEAVAVEVVEDGCGTFPGGGGEPFEQRGGRKEGAVALAGEDEEDIAGVDNGIGNAVISGVVTV